MSGKKLTSVIVDAGGTTTSWAFAYSDKTVDYIDTRSYHPVNFNEAFFAESKKFLKTYITEKVPVFFFGAGMGKTENKQILNEFLHPYFSSITILTDVQGIVLSLDMQHGAIAIMGTGSVLVEIMNGTIRQQIGGLGHLVGDEGSAYYFGKLVVTTYFENHLTDDQVQNLSEHFSVEKYSLEEALQMKYNIASLARQLDETLFEEQHVQNIQLFFKKHVTGQIEVNEINFVGSYAFFKKLLILRELNKIGVDKSKFIQKPIELFCDKFAIF